MMLEVQSFTFNPFQENTYLIRNQQQECWIVDPGMMTGAETNAFLTYLESNQLKPLAIINTHAHIDHILGIDAVTARYPIPFYLHEQEKIVLENAAHTALRFGFNFAGVQTTPVYLQEERFDLGNGAELELRFVPGHSPGSIALYYAPGNWVIGGDALFQGSIGRTDLPGGDHDTLLHSIREQLFSLPDTTKVYPGHGPATTIGNERMHNPFLR